MQNLLRITSRKQLIRKSLVDCHVMRPFFPSLGPRQKISDTPRAEGHRPSGVLGLAAGQRGVGSVPAHRGLRQHFSNEDHFIPIIGISMLTITHASLLILSLTFLPLSTFMELPVTRRFGKYGNGLYIWHSIINMIPLCSPLTERFGKINLVTSGLPIVMALAVCVLTALARYKCP